MEGLFKVTKLHAAGIPDEVWQRAIREKRVDELLRGLEVLERLRSKNLVFDNFAGYTFDFHFSGAQCADPWYRGGGGYFAVLNFDNRDDDQTYQEENQVGYNQPTSHSYITGVTKPGTSPTYKRFIEDDADAPDIIVDPTGRERIYFRSRFLFTPVQAVSDEIRGIAVWYSSTANSTGAAYRGISARTRLYDSKGRKVTLNKTIEEILLVEYEFSLTAI